MFARLTLAGVIEGEPELHYLASNGAPVVNFVVVSVTDSARLRVHCSVIGKKAEALAESLKPAQVVIAEGQMMADESGDPRSWTDKEGSLHTYFNLRVTSVDVIAESEGIKEVLDDGRAYVVKAGAKAGD